jgi:hypothetical protein
VTVPGDGLPGDGQTGYFVSVASGEVLDVERWLVDRNGAPVQVWHRKSTDVLNQQWRVRELAGRVFAISPLSGPGKDLEQQKWPARYGIPDSTVQWESQGRSSQLWSMVAAGDGTFEIVNQGSGDSIGFAGHGKALLVRPRVAGDPARLWRFEPVTG